ncbi:MAG TPA: VanW family protein [Stellaceae bacterium]
MTLAPDPPAIGAALDIAEWAIPTRWGSIVFRARKAFHQLRRGALDLAAGPLFLPKSDGAGFAVILGLSQTPLWSDGRAEERSYQLGKVQNLRRATTALDGVVIPAGAIFSFWKQIGRASRRRGFVTGRMLQQGCLVPATGGGLCQLSNALYEAALQAECEILERHAHSRTVSGSLAAAGRDATVAWNYVDLRFRAREAVRIEARVTRDDLVIRFRGRSGAEGGAAARLLFPRAQQVNPNAVARSCATCGEPMCFRHESPEARGSVTQVDTGRCAFLVDENWPEFQEYVGRAHRSGDTLGVPLDGATWRLSRYRWDRRGFAHVDSAPLQAIRRATAIRRAPTQGPARRQAEQIGAERIAARLARLLTPDVKKLVVAQSLLPFLWREGHLGGRDIDVLMTRLPIDELHARLDRAFAAHPERLTLGDFRAPQELLEAETEALAYASRIVTPHAEIARLFGEKSVTLEWRQPPFRPIDRTIPAPRRIAFPGPTVARKGAYEVREAARALDLEVLLLGSDLEGASFWDGVKTRKFDPAEGAEGWLARVAAVVQPAIAEDRPRHLLSALAAGVPVIATPACGLVPRPGVTIVPPDDVDALIVALRATLL